MKPLPARNQWVRFALSMIALCLLGSLQAATSPGKPDAGVVQFKAKQHLLGFRPGKVYLASLDHALSVEFANAKPVEPTVLCAGVSDGTPAPLGRVEYREPWEGVTVRFEAHPDGIAESTYVLAAGADVGSIQLRYNVPVQLEPDGCLAFRLSSKRGWIKESAPVAWQEIDGRKIPVPVGFSLRGSLVGFEVASYDRHHPLIIDPVYEWHTFAGQSQGDEGRALAVDSSGNVYVAGVSSNSLTPGTWNGPSGQAPLHAHSGNGDVVVMKLNSQGAYQWHTFYGDADRQWANGIAVDASGNVYVVGFTDGAQWLGDNSTAPLRTAGNDGERLVILKLNSAGAYQWHTFYGAWGDVGNAITVSGSSVYVTGYSSASSGQSWSGLTALHAHSGSGRDLMVLKLNTSGAYQWHTFYGAAGSGATEEGHAVAVDGSGNVYVAGESQFTWGSPLHDHTTPGTNGKPDMTILKLNSAGTYQWHTFYGATYTNPYWATGEVANAIDTDSNGNVYVTGESAASWLGPNGENPLHAYSASRDITVLKLNGSGAYQWHTFYGTSGNNYSHSIAVTEHGVYTAGDGTGQWLGDGNAAPIDALTTSSGLGVLKLDHDGGYLWHTFFNSAAMNIPHGLAADDFGNLFVAATSTASWLGTSSTLPLRTYTAGNDVTVVKLDDLKTLTLTVAGSGSGGITSDPAGIDYPAQSTAGFGYGTQVALVAVPDKGSTFQGWTNVDSTGFWDAAVVMDSDHQVGATFGTATAVRLLSPNRGEAWGSGSTQTIFWESPASAHHFKLKYSLNKGATWSSIASAFPITDSAFDWTLPVVPSNQRGCLVKVMAYRADNSLLGVDVSNGPFSIEVVRLLSPNGGEILQSGTPYELAWEIHSTTKPVSSIALTYSTNGGTSWSNIGTAAPGSTSLVWTPNVSLKKANCLVKIVLKDAGGVKVGNDMSNALFTIKP